MCVFEGIKVKYKAYSGDPMERFGTILKSQIIWDGDKYSSPKLLFAIITETNSFIILEAKEVEFSKEDIKRLKRYIPENTDSVDRFELMDME